MFCGDPGISENSLQQLVHFFLCSELQKYAMKVKLSVTSCKNFNNKVERWNWT
jgi:hypothetical protein